MTNQFGNILCDFHSALSLSLFCNWGEDGSPASNSINSTILLVYVFGGCKSDQVQFSCPVSLLRRRSTSAILTRPRLPPSHPRQYAAHFLGRNREPSRDSRHFSAFALPHPRNHNLREFFADLPECFLPYRTLRPCLQRRMHAPLRRIFALSVCKSCHILLSG